MPIENYDIERMKTEYPAFALSRRENDCVFCGELVLNHIFNDVRMTGTFELEIIVPGDYPLAFPTVREVSNNIDKAYSHLYTSGQFCLASNLELKMFFSSETDIPTFIEKFVIPYLYTYQFYEAYGVYPYGERSHGIDGDLEYLKDLFKVEKWDQVFDIMIFIVQSTYRGHLACPCGSGKRIRKCHGDILRQTMNADLRDECLMILAELRKRYAREKRSGERY